MPHDGASAINTVTRQHLPSSPPRWTYRNDSVYTVVSNTTHIAVASTSYIVVGLLHFLAAVTALTDSIVTSFPSSPPRWTYRNDSVYTVVANTTYIAVASLHKIAVELLPLLAAVTSSPSAHLFIGHDNASLRKPRPVRLRGEQGNVPTKQTRAVCEGVGCVRVGEYSSVACHAWP